MKTRAAPLWTPAWTLFRVHTRNPDLGVWNMLLLTLPQLPRTTPRPLQMYLFEQEGHFPPVIKVTRAEAPQRRQKHTKRPSAALHSHRSRDRPSGAWRCFLPARCERTRTCAAGVRRLAQSAAASHRRPARGSFRVLRPPGAALLVGMWRLPGAGDTVGTHLWLLLGLFAYSKFLTVEFTG